MKDKFIIVFVGSKYEGEVKQGMCYNKKQLDQLENTFEFNGDVENNKEKVGYYCLVDLLKLSKIRYYFDANNNDIITRSQVKGYTKSQVNNHLHRLDHYPKLDLSPLPIGLHEEDLITSHLMHTFKRVHIIAKHTSYVQLYEVTFEYNGLIIHCHATKHHNGTFALIYDEKRLIKWYNSCGIPNDQRQSVFDENGKVRFLDTNTIKYLHEDIII